VKSALPKSIHRKGRILLINNFYNTEVLVAWMKEQDLHMIGTIQPMRFNKVQAKPKPKWALPQKDSIVRGTMRVFNEIDDNGEDQGMYFIFLSFLYL
jgi:hypothetical protein